MTKKWMVLLGAAVFLTACEDLATIDTESVVEEDQQENSSKETEVQNEVHMPGSAVYDEHRYLWGANDLEIYEGDDLQDYVG